MIVRKLLMVLAICITGSVFSGCTKQVTQYRELAGKFATYEEKGRALEAKILKLDALEKQMKVQFTMAFDLIGKNGEPPDGVVTKEELTRALREKPMDLVSVMWSTKNQYGWWGVVVLVLIWIKTYFGLHGADFGAKVKQYGFGGMLGWFFKLLRFTGKAPDPDPPPPK